MACLQQLRLRKCFDDAEMVHNASGEVPLVRIHSLAIVALLLLPTLQAGATSYATIRPANYDLVKQSGLFAAKNTASMASSTATVRS